MENFQYICIIQLGETKLNNTIMIGYYTEKLSDVYRVQDCADYSDCIVGILQCEGLLERKTKTKAIHNRIKALAKRLNVLWSKDKSLKYKKIDISDDDKKRVLLKYLNTTDNRTELLSLIESMCSDKDLIDVQATHRHNPQKLKEKLKGQKTYTCVSCQDLRVGNILLLVRGKVMIYRIKKDSYKLLIYVYSLETLDTTLIVEPYHNNNFIPIYNN